jgi:hypothetical protein
MVEADSTDILAIAKIIFQTNRSAMGNLACERVLE